MTNSRTMEDWFLRGGTKPQPAENEKGQDGVDHIVGTAVCRNCGGMNLAGEAECTHCGASLTGGCPTDKYCGADDGGGELKTYIVTVTRVKTVDQYIKVRVTAGNEDEAEDVAMSVAETEDDANWTDDEDLVDYHDVEIENVEETE